MKVLVNGGLNLSETDGWWAEAYTPEVGWAIGDGREHGDDPAWDAAEAEAVYALLEQHVIPEFYERNQQGVPTRWVARIRESMARLTPEYSANRAVREYTEKHYLPGAAGYCARAAQGGRLGADILAWQQELARDWNGVSFGAVTAQPHDGATRVEAAVYLGKLDPGAVRVELFANQPGEDGPVRIEMSRGAQLPGDGFLYAASLAGDRPLSDFTARVIPDHANAQVPLEAHQILWQK